LSDIHLDEFGCVTALPSAVRRGCGIEPCDRVLLVAEPSEGILAVHPPATLDAIFSRFREDMMAGAA
jgi:hypothetical protein